MSRKIVFLYGALCYAAALATFLYLAGFLVNIGVPKAIDSPRTGPVGTALLVDVGLLALFGVQHSVMARPRFKRALTRFLPVPAERSTYVLASCVALGLLFWRWQPLGGVVWELRGAFPRAAAHALYAAGWTVVLVTTFLINHFDLFGLRQVVLHVTGRPYQPVRFATPGPYQVVRHPLYVGWILTFWAAPTMTVSHLVFALATTAYILVAIRFEERDLADMHPEYREYRRRVPMLVPRVRAVRVADEVGLRGGEAR
ncbi:MAG TPA: isoprenylcysteine carboxylmethyltransferase family protein [Planctomycetota bacterium]|nr:isoprenylcysteine carboxylmethyltransferase family protein [Planctomycetota bacterium]